MGSLYDKIKQSKTPSSSPVSSTALPSNDGSSSYPSSSGTLYDRIRKGGSGKSAVTPTVQENPNFPSTGEIKQGYTTEQKIQQGIDKLSSKDSGLITRASMVPVKSLWEMYKTAKNTIVDSTNRIGGFIDSVAPIAKWNQDEKGQLYLDKGESTPAERAGKALEATAGAANLALLPVSTAFAGAEQLPIVGKLFKGVGWLFGKAGEVGGWGGEQVINALPVSDSTKQALTPGIKDLSSLAAQLALGKAGEVTAPKLKAKAGDIASNLTKDIVEQNNLPKSVYMDATKIRDVIRGENARNISVTPDEAKLVRSLGLDGKQYKEALKNGLSIEIPAETLIKIIDKPWFAKAKELLNIEPTSRVISSKTSKPTSSPVRGMLPEGTPVEAGAPVVDVKKMKPTEIVDTPMSPDVLTRIKNFTQPEAYAFGKKIISSISESTGLAIDPKNNQLKPSEMISVIKGGSPDGRPAEYVDGKINFYSDQFANDIEKLAQGNKILAHGYGKNPVVYQLKPGESISELADRYFKDVMAHEYAHAKTIGEPEIAQIKTLQESLAQAVKSADQKSIIESQTALDKYLNVLEDKANEYMKSNYDSLIKELLPEAKGNKAVENAVTGKSDTKVTISEKTLLKNKIKIQASTAKKVVSEERKTIRQQIQNVLENSKNASERNTSLELLKQKIKDRSKFTNAYESVKNLFKNREETAKRKAELALLKTGIKFRTKYEKVAEDIKSTFLDRAAKRKELIAYTDFLPAAIRGKFIRRINSVSSDTQFMKVLESMKDASDTSQRRVLKKEIEKELKDAVVTIKKGLPVKGQINYDKETLKKLIRIKNGLKGNYEKAQMNADEILVKAAEENRPITDAEFTDVQMLQMIGIKDMTSKEMRNVLSNIKSLKESGRTAKELERFNKLAEDQRIMDGAIKTITGGMKSSSESQFIQRRKRPESLKETVKQAVGDFAVRASFGFEDMLDKISVLDKGSKPFESVLSSTIGRSVKNAFKKEFTGTSEQTNKLHNSISEVYKIKNQKDWNSFSDHMNQKINFGEFKDTEGKVKTLELTKGEAIDVYMKMQDETLLSSLENGNKFTNEILDKVVSSLSPEDRKLGDKLIEFYRSMYPGINEAFNAEFGIDLPFSENYSPVKRAIDFQKQDESLLTNEAKQYATTRNASLKQRTGSEAPIEFANPVETAMNHITRMEHYKAFSEPVRIARKVFLNKEVRNAIEEFHNPGDLKTIDGFINDFARGGVDKANVNKYIDTLRSNVTKSILGLNFHVAISQLTGVLNYAIDASPGEFIFGMADFFKKPFENSKFLVENSPVLKERFGDGYAEEIKMAMNRSAFNKVADIRPFQEKLFFFSKNMDKLTVLTGSWVAYKSKYESLIQKGMSSSEAKAKAIEYAEDVTLRTQESSRLDTKSSLQRGSSTMQLLTMFASQPIKMNRIIINEIRNAKAGRTSWKSAAKKVAIAWFFSQLAYQYVSNRSASTGEKWLNALASPLTNTLILGNAIQSIIGWSLGKPYGYKPSAVVSFMDDIQSGIRNIRQGDIDEAATYFIDLAGKLGGVPTKLVTKPVRAGIKATKE
jgi:hypothetical protein